MRIIFATLTVLALPLVEAWPEYIDCASDAETRLKEGNAIMGMKVTAASGVTMAAKRASESVSSYIQGEWLELDISGFPQQSGVVVRASDAANATFATTSKEFTVVACASQVASKSNVKLPTSSATVSFRPGCSDTADKATPLKLQFVSAANYGSAVLLTELSLTPEADDAGKVKQDKSCHGGPLPPAPSPPLVQQSSKYNILVWCHRIGVILTWGFLFPLGISLVRHNYSGARLKLHRYVQSIGFCVEMIQLICIIVAHHEGPTGQGPAPDDGDFSGVQGSAPSLTHKQRGLVVDICVLLQVILGIARPKPYPNDLLRRVWMWAHRFIGDSAIVVAWVNLWEAIAQNPDTPIIPVTIVTLMLQVTAVIGVPFFLMAKASKEEEESGGIIVSAPPPADAEGPVAHFYGCGDCNQVFTEQHALQVHYRFTHIGCEYKEIRTPMPQRFANVMNLPSVTAGVPLSEVMKHNRKDDCWVVLNGCVYDLTNFMSTHPGGPNPILSWAGRDASKAWNLIHQAAWLNQYANVEKVGSLAPEPPVPGMQTMQTADAASSVVKRTGFSHDGMSTGMPNGSAASSALLQSS
jgi:hypothetical protein